LLLGTRRKRLQLCPFKTRFKALRSGPRCS
jgi:hypothetical protein